MKTSECRACHAPIGFIKTINGKSMPVNTDPIRFSVGGNEVFVTENGNVLHGTRLTPNQAAPEEMTGYVSHFATCPCADRFRKLRKSDRKKT